MWILVRAPSNNTGAFAAARNTRRNAKDQKFSWAETKKVVIEITPDKEVTVYAVLLPNADDIRRVCEVFEAEVIRVASVSVGDDGTVTTTESET